MSLYNLKKVQVSSVLKILPVVFAIIGVVIGLFSFLFFPAGLASGLGFGARILSWIVFVVLYTAIMSVGAMLFVWLYNFVAAKLNSGIVVSLEVKE